MSDGYCTADDVRRLLQEKDFSGALADNSKQAVQDAIKGWTEWINKHTKKHWYVAGGISEDTEGIVPTSVKTRDDEYDLPTHAGYVVGAYDGNQDRATTTTGTVFSSSDTSPQQKEQIRLATGRDLNDDTIPAYCRIRLDRKNVDALNSLNVVNASGGYDDWVASNDYAGGVGTANRGDDYWVRVNNDGWSELYLDVHSLDDDVASLSNAVYVDYDFGDPDLPKGVRRAVAHLAAATLLEDEEFRAAVPDNGQLVNVQSKSETFEERGKDLLDHHLVSDPDDDA